MKLNIIVPVPPSINHLYINQYSWKKEKNGNATRIPTGKRILSKEGEKYKQNVKTLVEEQIKNQKWDYDKTSERFIYMDYDAFMNRKGRDSDNLHKLLQDTLKELIYVDDSRVLTRPNKIFVDRQDPRLEIEIKFVDFIGVFDNENQLTKYIENCKNCKRFRNKSCSILKDCIEGVINKEFDFIKKQCNKYNVIR